ncbi:hypothetical protein PtB15_3B603 [Puccinia triticina]|nr:hypothetical protein PtB15_3B603 [Puccinia triticina]
MEPATPKRPFAEDEPLHNDRAFKRFRDNLPPEEDPNSKEAFRLFWNEAGAELVNKYLDDLDSFSRDLFQHTGLTEKTFRPNWANFLAGDMTLEGFCRRLRVKDQRLKDRAVRLAFLRNHPGYSTNEAITVPQMSEALKCRDNGAELYLKSLLNKPAREALASGISVEIIKKGYDGDFLKSDTILKPLMTPDTVADLTNYYESFLIAIFEVVTEFFSKCKGTPNEELLKQWFNYNCPKNLQPEEVTDFSKAVSKKIDHHYGSFQKNPNNKASILLKKAVADMFTQTEGIHPSFNVLLAIDEARALLSSPKKIPNEFSFFRNFRRALQHIPPNKGFFTILADTTSQVANFNPAPKYDPSARGGLEKGVRLFDPIYQISSLDVLVPTNSPTSWNELTSAARLVNYGTPVYGAYWRDAQAESMNRSEVFSHIISLAQSKLLCSNQLPLPQNLTEYQALALLGTTIQPRLSGTLHLNSELVSSHAAHCDYISPGRDLILANYPSQFILASAANRTLADKEMLICCIKKLTATLRLGLDAKGVAGELASRIILSCAMREAMRKSKEDPVEIPYGRSANPYLVLFMSLKTKGDVAPLLPPDARRASQVFYGFKGYACLPEGVAEALEEMIQVEPDLRSLHQDQPGREYAHTVNPLVYTGPQS